MSYSLYSARLPCGDHLVVGVQGGGCPGPLLPAQLPGEAAAPHHRPSQRVHGRPVTADLQPLQCCSTEAAVLNIAVILNTLMWNTERIEEK